MPKKKVYDAAEVKRRKAERSKIAMRKLRLKRRAEEFAAARGGDSSEEEVALDTLDGSDREDDRHLHQRLLVNNDNNQPGPVLRQERVGPIAVSDENADEVTHEQPGPVLRQERVGPIAVSDENADEITHEQPVLVQGGGETDESDAHAEGPIGDDNDIQVEEGASAVENSATYVSDSEIRYVSDSDSTTSLVPPSTEDDTSAEDDTVIPSNPIPFFLDDEGRAAIPEDKKLEELVSALAAVKARCNVSDSAMDKLWKVVTSRSDTIKELVDTNQIGFSYRNSVKAVALKGTPAVTYGVLLEDYSTDPPILKYIGKLSGIPERYSNLTPQDRCVLLRQDAITSLKEIKQFHWTVVKSQGRSHASFLKDCSALDISIDGVQESNKAKRTLMIVSVRFGGGGIYVYRVFNPLIGIKHAKATREDIFRDFMNEIEADDDLKLRFVVADTPERHFLKGIVAIAGIYSCECCTATALTAPIRWPADTTMNFPLRTRGEMLEATSHLDDPLYDCKGVVAYTPMYEVPLPFDPIWHCPTEEFHLLKEGLTKMMVKRLFETRSTKESREVFQTWSTLYQGMCVFSETPRYTRNISTSKMKGCELGIIMYSAFPSLVELMVNRKDDFWSHAQRALAIFTFVIRAYNIPDNDFQEVIEVMRRRNLSFEKLHEIFYREFVLGFCGRSARPTINVHAFYHLFETRMRTGVPLSVTSAEPFEALYAVLRRCYVSGTRNVPKQIFENCYSRIKHTTFHGLDRKLKIGKPTNSKRIRDSIVLTKAGVLAEVISEEAPWRAHPVIVNPYRPQGVGLNLPWDMVGVHRYGGLDYTRVLQVDKKDIVGKAMLCSDMICTWHKEWMMSKVDN